MTQNLLEKRLATNTAKLYVADLSVSDEKENIKRIKLLLWKSEVRLARKEAKAKKLNGKVYGPAPVPAPVLAPQ